MCGPPLRCAPFWDRLHLCDDIASFERNHLVTLRRPRLRSVLGLRSYGSSPSDSFTSFSSPERSLRCDSVASSSLLPSLTLVLVPQSGPLITSYVWFIRGPCPMDHACGLPNPRWSCPLRFNTWSASGSLTNHEGGEWLWALTANGPEGGPCWLCGGERGDYPGAPRVCTDRWAVGAGIWVRGKGNANGVGRQR